MNKENDPFDSFKTSFNYNKDLNFGLGNTFDYNSIPIDMVKRVDIIPPSMTALFGSRVGFNALVVITSKDGSELRSNNHVNMMTLNMQVTNPLGYQKPSEFYSPKYETKQQRNAPERDLRTTVYWNPVVRSNEFGFAVLKFYSADGIPEYSIKINGIKKETPLSYSYDLSNFENY